nr:asparaginase [Allorhizocola rhizosphaerae]
MAARVAVFALGGTIAMTRAAGGGATPTLSGEKLLAAVPGLAETGIGVEVVNFRQLPGAALGFDDVIALCRAIADQAGAAAADGFVVTQGTDTIEETAYLLHLWHGDDRPVVVTGAMRNPSLAGADGAANLLAAIVTAASPAAAGRGALVVFADEIHAGSMVRKTHATSVATFRSPNGGPLGHVIEGQARFLAQMPNRLRIPLPTKEIPSIGVYSVAFGDDGGLLDAFAQSVDGLVVAAMGAGHVPETMVGRLAELASAMPVVLASRTGAGSILRETYGFPGSERYLIARGLLPAGFLDPFKARLLLAAALAAGADRDQIAAAVAVAAGYAGPQAWPFS